MAGTSAPVARLLERAMALMGRGEHAQALEICDEALRDAPDSAPAHLTRSVALHRLGRGADALSAATAACRLRPDWAEAWTNVGHHQFAQGDLAAAAQAFTRAGDIATDRPGPCVNAGMAWERLQAWSRAAEAYRAAYDRAPANTAIWEACDRTLELTGQPDAAAALFADHVRRVPLSARLAAAGLVHARMLADPALEARCFEAVVTRDWQHDELPALVHAIGALQYYDVPRERLLALYRRANEFRQQKRRGDTFRIKRRLARGEPMRVGYLSADFRVHPMGLLMVDILRNHDPAVVEPYLFSLAMPGNEDGLTERCRRLARHYEVLTPFDDRAAAERIAAHELDLLVDLMSLTGFARSGILLHKPAPVIATHLGHHGPIGLEQVDYKITDAFADPPANAAFQIERLLPLATCVLPFRRVAPAPDSPTRAALGLPQERDRLRAIRRPEQAVAALPRAVGAVPASGARGAPAVVAGAATHGRADDGTPGRLRHSARARRFRSVRSPTRRAGARATPSPISCSTRFPTPEAKRPSRRSTWACRWSPSRARGMRNGWPRASSIISVCPS